MPRASTRPPPAGHYRILPGDTLFKIAFLHNLDARELAAWNQLTDPGRIRAGDLIRLTPLMAPTSSARAIALAPPPAIEEKPLPATAAQVTANVAAQPTMTTVEAFDGMPERWIWPSTGPLLARFGEGRNKGIDIGGKAGQPVLAAAEGEVAYAGTGLRGYGKLIIIRHGKTLLSAYAHNRAILVSEGQRVELGDRIAEMGDSDAEKVMLHFEIREHGKPVNPLNFLPGQGG